MAHIVIELVLSHLGLRESSGWVEAADFDLINGPNSALRRAHEFMGVKGAFGTWQHNPFSDGKRFIPLLYVATAESAELACNDVHRRVWTQGVVPLLIICTPQNVYLSEGYDFAYEEWERCVTTITCDELHTLQTSTNAQALDRFKPERLLSSIAWRDFALNPSKRVDRRLLAALESISASLSISSGADIKTCNALIGRFLYFYILRDRGFLTAEWLNMFHATDVFETRTKKLTTKIVWAVFDELDHVFNGTIFPMSKRDRSRFSDKDVQLLRDCMKLGDSLEDDGKQLSFFNFDISSIQTETLSAIYEQFLETENSTVKREDGAFYTPPYLADFVLDAVEDISRLTSKMRIIDCTAGSGVFVVGAFRRIIENKISKTKKKSIRAHTLRNILSTSIFAIEKNSSAHSVAAFSLYLTMLDYVDYKDIQRCLLHEEQTQLFPKLSDHNLICDDTFSPSATSVFEDKFDIVIGNPPWQKIGLITPQSPTLESHYSTNVDTNEAAEYTLWWAAETLLKSSGVMALLMPTKSLVGPSAKRFPAAVAREFDILGVANFSHFRYLLFENARQATCCLFLQNRKPSRNSSPWIYSPTRAHVPSPINSGPWTLTLDRSQLQIVPQRQLQNNDDSWFESLMLKPVDRYIRRYIHDSIDIGNIINLGTLFDNEGISIARGGSPSQTNLSPKYIYGADKFKANNILSAPGIKPIISDQQLRLQIPDTTTSRRNSEWIKSVNTEFLERFSGNSLILSRSMRIVAYAQQPVAFNSSLNVVYFRDNKTSISTRSKRSKLLHAIGLYLQSDIAQYLVALTGKLWILDKTRLEKNDLLKLPVPFSNISDPFIDKYLCAPPSSRSSYLCEKLGLTGWLVEAANEYAVFRSNFEDGGVPESIDSQPSKTDIKNYARTLGHTVRPISTNSRIPKVHIRKTNDPIRPMVVSIHLANNNSQTDVEIISTFDTEHVAEFSDSSLILSSKDQSHIELHKPNGKLNWTIESAYMDGIQVMQRLMN